MGSSRRRFAIFLCRRVGACLPGSSVSADSILDKDSSSAAGSLRFPPEPGISRFRRPPGGLCHYWESTPRAKPCLSTKSPCLVASRNPEESIV